MYHNLKSWRTGQDPSIVTSEVKVDDINNLMEKMLEDVSFDAPDLGTTRLVIDEVFVRERLQDLVEDEDLSRFIL